MRPQLPACSLANVRLTIAALALTALTGLAGHAVMSMPPPGEHVEQPVDAWKPPPKLAPTHLTARTLLESGELADVATDQLMAVGHDSLTSEDRHMVRAVAGAGFGNISLMIQNREPVTARQLSSFQLTEEQKLSVLGVVRHMGDPRVQRVGRELTRALRDFLDASATDNRADMESHIRRALQPRLSELRQLRDEVLTAPLRQAGSTATGDASTLGGRWGVAINTERMRVVKTFSNKWKLEFDMSRPQRSTQAVSRRLQREEDSKLYGVAGGVAEQARVLLDQLQAVLGQFGIDTEVPGWITSLDGTSKPFLSELLACVKDSIGDAALMITCPMKFASAGIDVFSSLSEPAPTAAPVGLTGSAGKRPDPGSGIPDNVLWRDW